MAWASIPDLYPAPVGWLPSGLVPSSASAIPSFDISRHYIRTGIGSNAQSVVSRERESR